MAVFAFDMDRFLHFSAHNEGDGMGQGKLSGKLEDYLEAVWILENREGHAHVQDIADAVGVHKSTVSTALQSLSEKKLVNYEPYQAATLTKAGRKTAAEVDRKHKLISRFMTSILLLDPKTADVNACRMEHALDAHVSKRLADFLVFVEQTPERSTQWLEEFRRFLRERRPSGGAKRTDSTPHASGRTSA